MKITYTLPSMSQTTTRGSALVNGTTFTGQVGAVVGLFIKVNSFIIGLSYLGTWPEGSTITSYQPVSVTVTVDGVDPSVKS